MATMTRILILLASLFLVRESFALPPCPTGVFHNCFGTYTYANGDTYVGEFKDGNYHGQGTKTWTSFGSKYVGEFKDNKQHGHGTYTWASGSKYVGEFKDNKQHGQGTYTWASGNKYVGGWKDGAPSEGVYYSASGKVQGTYSNGKGCKGCKPTARQLAIVREINQNQIATILPPCPASGYWDNCFGTYTWASGDTYVGEFKDNKQHGQGTYTWASGNKYVGEWKDNNRHGQGTYTHGKGEWEGDKYVGEYKYGKKHGQGTYTAANGDKYVGEYKYDKKHGQGINTWASGNKYVGEWKDGKIHGQGILTYVKGEFGGDKYVGEWKDGNRHGQGTKTWANGDKYVGEWKDNDMHGQGTKTWANGDKYVGEWLGWKDRHGQGTKTWANGDKYVGEWKYDYKWQGAEYNASGELLGMLSDGLATPACDGNPASNSWGTGFAVSQHHVVTNAHVLYCCKTIIVHDLESCRHNAATIVATEQRSDLGLLRLDKPVKHHATLRRGKELQLGEEVSTYDRRPVVDSCPRYVVGQGKVTELNWMPDDSRLMVHDAPTRAGSSGGPVLDASAHIVGVSTLGGVPESTTRSDAVKSYLLEGFLKTNSIEYNTAPSIEKLSRSEIKERSDKFTLIVKCMR
jgi:hypothetical protein